MASRKEESTRGSPCKVDPGPMDRREAGLFERIGITVRMKARTELQTTVRENLLTNCVMTCHDI